MMTPGRVRPSPASQASYIRRLPAIDLRLVTVMSFHDSPSLTCRDRRRR